MLSSWDSGAVVPNRGHLTSLLYTPYTSVVKAIKILAKEYYKRLDENDFRRTTDSLSDKVKASVFITLLEKEIRDKWLERNAGIMLLG